MPEVTIRCAGGCGAVIGTVRLPEGRAYPGDEHYGMLHGDVHVGSGCGGMYGVLGSVPKVREAVARGILRKEDIPPEMVPPPPVPVPDDLLRALADPEVLEILRRRLAPPEEPFVVPDAGGGA